MTKNTAIRPQPGAAAPRVIRLSEGVDVPLVVATNAQLQETDDILRQVSIVVPVRDDVRVFACVSSIDEEVEVVIVCNGSTPAFERMLKSFLGGRAKIVSLAEPGIGRAYNAGIGAASGRYILLMDSDCTFHATAIRHLAFGLRKDRIVKGRIEFDSAGRSSRFTAKVRAATEDPMRSRKASSYSPPLIYDRDVVDLMGGYHFSDELVWREDRDFELRRRQARIPMSLAPRATISHGAITTTSDLRNVYKYGQGEALGRALGLFPEERTLARLRKTVRTAVRLIRDEHSLDVMLYFLCRRAAFNLGYLRQRSALRRSAPATRSTPPIVTASSGKDEGA